MKIPAVKLRVHDIEAIRICLTRIGCLLGEDTSTEEQQRQGVSLQMSCEIQNEKWIISIRSHETDGPILIFHPIKEGVSGFLHLNTTQDMMFKSLQHAKIIEDSKPF